MNHKEHPMAERVMELTERNMTSTMIARLERMQQKTVRLIKLAHQDPGAYAEWQMMEQKRFAEERKEAMNHKEWGMTEAESESCRLAKLWK